MNSTQQSAQQLSLQQTFGIVDNGVVRNMTFDEIAELDAKEEGEAI